MKKTIISDELMKKAMLIYEEKFFDINRINNEEVEFSEKFQKKISKTIKSENSLYHRATLTKTRKAICVFVAILVLLLSMLSVGAIREAIAGFFVNYHKGYNTIRAEKTNTDYPKKLEKVYELGEVPEGYILSNEHIGTEDATYLYLCEDNSLMFVQYTKNTYSSNADNENSKYTVEEYNGQKFYVQTIIDGSYIFRWDDGEYIFFLSADLPKKDIVHLCTTLKIKEN